MLPEPVTEIDIDDDDDDDDDNREDYFKDKYIINNKYITSSLINTVLGVLWGSLTSTVDAKFIG